METGDGICGRGRSAHLSTIAHTVFSEVLPEFVFLQKRQIIDPNAFALRNFIRPMVKPLNPRNRNHDVFFFLPGFLQLVHNCFLRKNITVILPYN